MISLYKVDSPAVASFLRYLDNEPQLGAYLRTADGWYKVVAILHNVAVGYIDVYAIEQDSSRGAQPMFAPFYRGEKKA